MRFLKNVTVVAKSLHTLSKLTDHVSCFSFDHEDWTFFSLYVFRKMFLTLMLDLIVFRFHPLGAVKL